MELHIYMSTCINVKFFCILQKEWSLAWLKTKCAVLPISPPSCLTISLRLAWGLLLGRLVRYARPCAHVSAVLRWLQFPWAAGSSSHAEFTCQSLKFTELLGVAFGNRGKKFCWEILCISKWKDVYLHTKISTKAHPVVSTYNHAPFDLCTFY